MPILFTHFLSGIVVLGVIWLLYRQKFTHPFFYFFGIFCFMFPDIDHLPSIILFWDPQIIWKIIPMTLEDLFRGIFMPRQSFMLHDWFFPSILTLISLLWFGLSTREEISPKLKYLVVLAAGWAVHIALDGVML
jgi:hypothetical protein